MANELIITTSVDNSGIANALADLQKGFNKLKSQIERSMANSSGANKLATSVNNASTKTKALTTNQKQLQTQMATTTTAVNAQAKAFQLLDQAMEATKNMAINAGKGIGASIVAGLTAGTIAFIAFTKASVDASNQIQRMSLASGISAKSISSWSRIIVQGGGSVEDATDMIKDFTDKLGDARNGNEEFQKMFKNMGVNIAGPADQAFQQTISSLGQMEDKTKAMNIGMKIFSDNYVKAASEIAKGSTIANSKPLISEKMIIYSELLVKNIKAIGLAFSDAASQGIAEFAKNLYLLINNFMNSKLFETIILGIGNLMKVANSAIGWILDVQKGFMINDLEKDLEQLNKYKGTVATLTADVQHYTEVRDKQIARDGQADSGTLATLREKQSALEKYTKTTEELTSKTKQQYDFLYGAQPKFEMPQISWDVGGDKGGSVVSSGVKEPIADAVKEGVIEGFKEALDKTQGFTTQFINKLINDFGNGISMMKQQARELFGADIPWLNFEKFDINSMLGFDFEGYLGKQLFAIEDNLDKIDKLLKNPDTSVGSKRKLLDLQFGFNKQFEDISLAQEKFKTLSYGQMEEIVNLWDDGNKEMRSNWTEEEIALMYESVLRWESYLDARHNANKQSAKTIFNEMKTAYGEIDKLGSFKIPENINKKSEFNEIRADLKKVYSEAITTIDLIKQKAIEGINVELKLGIIGKDDAEQQIKEVESQATQALTTANMNLVNASNAILDQQTQVMYTKAQLWTDATFEWMNMGIGMLQTFYDAEARMAQKNIETQRQAMEDKLSWMNTSARMAYIIRKEEEAKIKKLEDEAMKDEAENQKKIIWMNTAVSLGSMWASIFTTPKPMTAQLIIGGITSAMLLANAAVQSANIDKYEDGGIVGGTSYTGDKQIARVNSKEMILNQSQQAQLFNMANGSGGGKPSIALSIQNFSGNDEDLSRLENMLYSLQANNRLGMLN